MDLPGLQKFASGIRVLCAKTLCGNQLGVDDGIVAVSLTIEMILLRVAALQERSLIVPQGELFSGISKLVIQLSGLLVDVVCRKGHGPESNVIRTQSRFMKSLYCFASAA